MKKLILISALLFSFNGWADEDYDLDGDGVTTLSEYNEARLKEEENMVFKYQTLNECMKEESKECQTDGCVTFTYRYCKDDVRYPTKPRKKIVNPFGDTAVIVDPTKPEPD